MTDRAGTCLSMQHPPTAGIGMAAWSAPNPFGEPTARHRSGRGPETAHYDAISR